MNRPSKPARAVATLLLAAIMTCGGLAATRPRPNVVLFLIDTARADHLHCLGYPLRTSPSLDAVAREGTLFEGAIASSSWTLPSYCSILTSLHPPSHAVNESAQYFDKSFSTLPKILSTHGYATGGFVGGGHFSRIFGFQNGFGTYLDEPHFGSFFHTVPEALEWLDAGAGKGPFFALVQGYDAHLPYKPPLGFAEMYDPDYRGPVHDRDLLNDQVMRNIADNVAKVPARSPASTTGARPTSAVFASSFLDVPPGTAIEQIPLSQADRKHIAAHYDGATSYTDSWLGVLRQELGARGLLGNTILIVAGVHGESLGEHGYYGHTWDLYEEQLHVPLAFSGPGIAAGRRIGDIVGMVDLAPTVLELCSVDACNEFQGRSLAPLIRAAAPPPLPADGIAFSSLSHTLSARTARWHLVLDSKGKTMLFDPVSDPTEQKNVSASNPETRELLRGQLLDWHEKHQRAPRAPDAKLTLEERQLFRQKGYW